MEHEAACIAAIRSSDGDSALGLLDTTPELANAHNEAGLSVLLLATCYGRRKIADAISNRRNLDCYEAAALGNDVQAQTLLNTQPELIDAANVDGFIWKA